MAQRWEDCAPLLERILKAQPGNIAALRLKANNQYMLGDISSAEQILLGLLDRSPNDAEAAYMLGRMYYMDNRAEYALGQFQRVVRVDPKHYKAWDNLGLCYQALGQTDTAIRHFLTAIKLVDTAHPDYDWPYANLSELLLEENRDQEAYQAAMQAAKRNPGSARNFFLGGKALLRLNREQDAAKWLERSIALDSAYPEPLYVLGQLYMKTGEKEKAAELLKRFREVKEQAPRKRR